MDIRDAVNTLLGDQRVPLVLYHASNDPNFSQLEPREESSRFSNEGPLVFATPDKAVAAMFLAPKDGGSVEISKFNDQSVIIINNKIENFKKKDRGGAIYTLPSETFTTDSTTGMKETEWVSKVPVKILSKEMYKTSLEAMKQLGVRVYFVNDKTFKSIQSSDDHGWEILSKLKPYF